MLKEVINHAEQAGVCHLSGGAEATRHASMFWYKNNFSLKKFGKIFDDVNEPDTYGNFQRIMFYRINKTPKVNILKKIYRVMKADKEQLDWIYHEHIIKISPGHAEYYKDKKDEFFGLAAADKTGDILGFIAAYADELGSPLDGTEWVIPYVFVRPDLRRQGIGSVLISEMAKAAEEAEITQLLFIGISEEAGEFWYKNNFDMCINYIMKMQDGKNPVSAALRIL